MHCYGFTQDAVRMGATALMLLAAASQALATKEIYRPKTGICGAAVDGDVKRVQTYLKEDPAAIHERDRGATALHWAARHGRDTVVALLLTNGAPVDSGTADGSTPLHMASLGGWTETAKTLLESHADVNAKTDKGTTPLLLACRRSHEVGFVQVLLDHDADVNMKDNSGVTPLQVATFRGEAAIAQLLLSHGADVNAHGCKSATALHWAVDGRQRTMVVLLLENGAQVQAVDDAEKTPLQWAQELAANEGWRARRKLRLIAKLLEQRDAKE